MKLIKHNWKLRIKRFGWQHGNVWNWFLIPSLEIQPWSKCVTCPKPGDYYTVFVCSQFLKWQIAIGLSRERYE